MTDFGARLRQLRLAAKMTASQAGVEAGRTGGYVREIERGRRPTSEVTVRALVAALVPVEAERERVVDELLALAAAAGELGEEPAPQYRTPAKARRPAPASASERIDRKRSAAMQRGDWPAAAAYADEQLALAGSPPVAPISAEAAAVSGPEAAYEALAHSLTPDEAWAMLPPADLDAIASLLADLPDESAG